MNVSLETLRPERFRAIARSGDVADVLAGVEAALVAGLATVKINVVVMNGVNDDEIPDFVDLTRRRPVHVRFIELMPSGETGFFDRSRWLPLPEIQSRCGPLERLEPGEAPQGFGPAAYFKAPGGRGAVGLIGALSCGFCGGCNRLRLTARGRLLPCLASEAGLDLGARLRSGASDGDIAEAFVRVVAAKPERHAMEPDARRARDAFMCALGG